MAEQLDVDARPVEEALRKTDTLQRQLEATRNLNKKRNQITRNLIRALKKAGSKTGQEVAGIFGERGLKLRGIVGAAAGLLAVDKGAQVLKDLLQGKDLKEAIGFHLKELIPPFLRDTVPAIFDELNRRERIKEESKRKEVEFHKDLNKRLRGSLNLRTQAAQEISEAKPEVTEAQVGQLLDPEDAVRFNIIRNKNF